MNRNILLILSCSIAIAAFVVDGVDLSANRVKCQSTFYANMTAARNVYPKAEVEFNKFYNNGTCQIQCLLKTGPKNFKTMSQITAADYVPCKPGNAAISAKSYCYEGRCLIPAEISTRLATNNTIF